MPTGKAWLYSDNSMPLQAPIIPDYQQIYAAKFSQLAHHVPEQLTPVAAAELYDSGLDAAAATAMASITPQNRQRRSQLQQELNQHLQSLPYGRTLANCTPEDLLVYMQKVYLPRHAGSMLPSGECIAAPSTISNVLSHLRMMFKELGRGSQWIDTTRVGNPAASHQLSQWCTGHDKLSLAAGFKTTSAVAMQPETIKQLLIHLLQQLTAAGLSAYDHAMAARDGFAFCLLWNTGMRGINSREIQLSDFLLPGQQRGSLQAYLHSHGFSTHPGVIQVHPQRTKTLAQNPYQISIPPAEEPVLDTFYWLTAVLSTALLLGQPIQGYLVRTTARGPCRGPPGNPHFSDQPLSSSGLHDRLVRQLKSLSIYHGESLHSFRRGMAQYHIGQGQPAEEVMAQMLLETRRILETVYLPVHRQQTGIKRVRCIAGQARPAML